MRAEAVLRPRDDAAPAHGRRPLRPVDDDLESSADSDVCFARLVDECDETRQRGQVGGEGGGQLLEEDSQVRALQHELPESLGERLIAGLEDDNPALGHRCGIATRRPRAFTHAVPPLALHPPVAASPSAASPRLRQS